MTESATLTFDLTDHDAKESFLLALKAANYKSVLQQLDLYLRNNTKYGNHPEEIEEIYQEVRERLYKLLDQWEVGI